MEAGQGKVGKWETGKENSQAAQRASNRLLSCSAENPLARRRSRCSRPPWAHLCPQVPGAVSGAAEQRLNIALGETSGRSAARCEPWEKRQWIRRAPPGVIERFQSPLTGLCVAAGPPRTPGSPCGPHPGLRSIAATRLSQHLRDMWAKMRSWAAATDRPRPLRCPEPGFSTEQFLSRFPVFPFFLFLSETQ